MTAARTEPFIDVETYRLRRASQDLYARALVGPFFYVMAWVLVLAFSDYVQRYSWLMLLPATVFCGFWVARYRHRLPDDDTSAPLTRWAHHHWLVVHGGSLCWGLVPAAVGWLERKPDSAILIASLSTMAFCTAASQSFAMHHGRARNTILLLLAPGVTVFLVIDDLRATGVTFFFYGLYLLANLRRSAGEYSRQLETEVDLIKSRAEVALLSLTDALTGLPNRRKYELVWEQLSNFAVRQRTPLALLAVDLDHFKLVNDSHGHVAGDACLRHFAGVLREQCRRESDFIARIGGEEFVLLLPGTTVEQATRFAEALRDAVSQRPCVFNGAEIAQTISVGVAVLGPDDASASATFERADAACYAAKRLGRDRVEVWTPAIETRRRFNELPGERDLPMRQPSKDTSSSSTQ